MQTRLQLVLSLKTIIFYYYQADLRKVRNYLLPLVNKKCKEIKYFLVCSSNFDKRGEKSENERRRAQKETTLLGRKIGLCFSSRVSADIIKLV